MQNISKSRFQSNECLLLCFFADFACSGQKLEASLESAAALIKTVIVPEASLDKHYKTARGVVHTVVSMQEQDDVKYSYAIYLVL